MKDNTNQPTEKTFDDEILEDFAELEVLLGEMLQEIFDRGKEVINNFDNADIPTFVQMKDELAERIEMYCGLTLFYATVSNIMEEEDEEENKE